jgi:hypothetical protein
MATDSTSGSKVTTRPSSLPSEVWLLDRIFAPGTAAQAASEHPFFQALLDAEPERMAERPDAIAALIFEATT